MLVNNRLSTFLTRPAGKRAIVQRSPIINLKFEFLGFGKNSTCLFRVFLRILHIASK